MLSIQKFKNSFSGIFKTLIRDKSILVQIILGIAVLILSLFFGLPRIEFAIILFVIFFMVVLESINTVMEKIMDLTEPRYSDMVRDIKNAMSGIIMLAGIGSAIVGIMIFLPYFISFLNSYY